MPPIFLLAVKIAFLVILYLFVARAVRAVVLDVFGPDRVMFASNFPVDGLTGTYQDIMGGLLEITSSWSPDEQRKAFAENAVRRYRLDPAVLKRSGAPVRRETVFRQEKVE